jgi:hypothetical protein
VKIKCLTAAVIILALACQMVANAQRRAGRQSPPKPTPTIQRAPALSTLTIEAGLVYQSGDTKPVTRTTFYLLDEDLEVILKSAGLTGYSTSPAVIGVELDLLRVSGKSAEYDRIMAAIAQHTVASETTDFGGKAKFTALKPGVRFLYGNYSVGRNRAVWHMKLEIKPGTDTALVLDNDNALSVRSVRY